MAPAPVIDSQLDPRVTQDTIKTTIAVPGWTKRVRPPESVTNRIKREKMSEHGYADSPRDYELDHFIPLELGGSSDQSNLWPEPIGEARQKDKLENKAHADVVSGRLTLKQGRQEIRDAYHIY
ncbi:MAG: HNH endonuclease [Chloroflexi bacterium]|nr:HNH endonuclease [Chloroflexota bacterium]